MAVPVIRSGPKKATSYAPIIQGVATIGGGVAGGLIGGPAGVVAGAGLGSTLGGGAGQLVDSAQKQPSQSQQVPVADNAMQRALDKSQQAMQQPSHADTLRESLLALPQLPPEQRKEYAPTLTQAYMAAMQQQYNGGTA